MKRTALIASLIAISMTLGPLTATAQNTESEPPICRTTDGRRFATDDQVRKCLLDAARAKKVDEANAASAAATGTANQEKGRRLQLQADKDAADAKADRNLAARVRTEQENEQLRKRPTKVVAVIIAVAAFLLGGAAGFGGAKLAK